VINLKVGELVVFRDPVNADYQWQQTLTAGIISPLSFPEVQVDVVRLIGQPYCWCGGGD
jgi:hypothetical protein